MQVEPLPNLTEQSPRVGTWQPSVATAPRSEEYNWIKPGASGAGKQFERLLVSEDSTEYCVGQFRKKGKEPAATKEFNAAFAKFSKSSTWMVNKVTLAKTDSKHFGCSHKLAIDLNASNFKPVLQGNAT